MRTGDMTWRYGAWVDTPRGCSTAACCAPLPTLFCCGIKAEQLPLIDDELVT